MLKIMHNHWHGEVATAGATVTEKKKKNQFDMGFDSRFYSCVSYFHGGSECAFNFTMWPQSLSDSIAGPVSLYWMLTKTAKKLNK